jgi:hypothetical protein
MTWIKYVPGIKIMNYICKTHNSSCSKGENIHNIQGFRHIDAIVLPHIVAKNKMFRGIFLPKKVQEVHQKAAQILPNLKHNGNDYKDTKTRPQI